MQPFAEELRSFNRFYTRHIGLLDKHLLSSPFSLAEARVLYELAHGAAATAADLSRTLGMDKAHLSRLLARLRSRGLITGRVSPQHAKHHLLSLTDSGKAAIAALERSALAQMEALLAPLPLAKVDRLIAASRTFRDLLRPSQPASEILLRPPRTGELAWVAHRQAVLYEREYGFDHTFEALLCEIVAGFQKSFDPTKEQAWIAEANGGIAGSVFLVRGDENDTAKLRLLYVEPQARGSGIGRVLVAACIERARQIGYLRLSLWTNDILVAARRLYQSAGFRLVAEEPHHSFGRDLIGQTWTLDLTNQNSHGSGREEP